MTNATSQNNMGHYLKSSSPLSNLKFTESPKKYINENTIKNIKTFSPVITTPFYDNAGIDFLFFSM